MDDFNKLYRKQQSWLRKYVSRKVCPQEVDDVTQNVWIEASRSLQGLNAESEGSQRGWLRTIARRIIYRHHRRRHVDEQLVELLDPRVDPPEFEDKQLAEKLLDTIAASSKGFDRRALAWWVFVEGHSIEEVARALGRTGVALRYQIHEIRALARKRIRNFSILALAAIRRKGRLSGGWRLGLRLGLTAVAVVTQAVPPPSHAANVPTRAHSSDDAAVDAQAEVCELEIDASPGEYSESPPSLSSTLEPTRDDFVAAPVKARGRKKPLAPHVLGQPRGSDSRRSDPHRELRPDLETALRTTASGTSCGRSTTSPNESFGMQIERIDAAVVDALACRLDEARVGLRPVAPALDHTYAGALDIYLEAIGRCEP